MSRKDNHFVTGNSRLEKNLKYILLILFIVVVGFGYYYFLYEKEGVVDENIFSQSIKDIPQAREEAEIVELSNGDEIDIEASYVVKEIGNRKIRMIAYNKSVPGPFLKVQEEAEITVHFTNNLDIDTTLHSHGLRLDFENDGSPHVSQDPIKPGETFTYTLKFPDGGTYWYHPHIREDYAQELGAYGSYDVERMTHNLNLVNTELNLLIDDILFEDEKMPPFYKDRTNFAIMGRFGDVMLVNGITDYSKEFNKGDVVRLNITNTANARPFDLRIPNAKMKLVASDLSPYEKETYIENIIISPSERYIIDVYFENSGTYELIHTSHDRAFGEIKYTMAQFKVNESDTKNDYSDSFKNLKEYQHVTDDFNKHKDLLYKKPDRQLTLDLDPGNLDFGSAMDNFPCHRMPDGTWMGKCTESLKNDWLSGLTNEEKILGGEKIHWEDHSYELNKKTTDKDITWQIIDKNSNKTNMKINDWKYNVGDTIKVRVFNDPMSVHPMQHPFHIHGQRMMTLSINGKPVENHVWKDTILIPIGDTFDILVEFSNPGIWMAHCHIAEHLAAGMMFNVAVGEDYFEMYDRVNSSHESH